MLLFVALLMAASAGFYLARRMIIPIRMLQDGAARIGRGDLGRRIIIKTGDELEALGNQFNSMAAQLQESYATLERKVDERTHQLEMANLAKSRFLASASHDLRQPLHALGLFVGQLRTSVKASDRRKLIEKIDSSIAAMNELFNALLDISKLDAGVLTSAVSDVALMQVLRRIESTFAGPAGEKQLLLRIVPTTAWVRSDPILLERILLNLVSNSVRYTSQGGVLVGCRKRGADLRIEIYDTGPGIPIDQRQKIFGEFYRLDDSGHGGRGGMGLGLAIVERLCMLLSHSIEVTSILGRGSRFTVVVPRSEPLVDTLATPIATNALTDVIHGKLVLVIDDDSRVLDGMNGLLRGWGCRVLSASSGEAALIDVTNRESAPDLIVSDYRLKDGKTGIEAIEQIRVASSSLTPAFLLSGDTNPDLLREAQAKGFYLLHKPVDPMTLRAMLNHMLKSKDGAM
jgi:signal transduction histidine kinase/CheY-like chemotaxis protein